MVVEPFKLHPYLEGYVKITFLVHKDYIEAVTVFFTLYKVNTLFGFDGGGLSQGEAGAESSQRCNCLLLGRWSYQSRLAFIPTLYWLHRILKIREKAFFFLFRILGKAPH